MIPVEELRDVAQNAARAAGAIQRERYGTLLEVDDARRNDIKLEVDRLCEEAIVNTICNVYPDHSILAEECGAIEGSAGYCWIIDPLDGTVNFYYGLPYFCTSIACYRQAVDSEQGRVEGLSRLGEAQAAAVYAPPTNELFLAAKGCGTTLNGKAIHASAASDLSEALVATGFGSQPENIARMFDRSRALSSSVRKLRCLGAAAYDLANVAAGRIPGFVERGIRAWDIAAGKLLIEEAGGKFSATEYEPGRYDVLAGGAMVHPLLKETLAGL